MTRTTGHVAMRLRRGKGKMAARLVSAIAFAATALALTACGEDETSTHQIHTASNGEEFNAADIAFATDMIQHHAQALQRTAMTAGRELGPEVEQLVEDVRMAQSPEVERMVTWLTSWGQPVPETVLDHANAHGDGHVESDMPGTINQAQLETLEAARGSEFERLFLEMMIEHHHGAIEMAQAQQSEGHFAPAVDLAGRIEVSQQREIATMQALLP